LTKNKIVKTTRRFISVLINNLKECPLHEQMIAMKNSAIILLLQNGFNTMLYIIFKNTSKINTRIQNSA
jgi:hypothetical protein